MAVEKICDDDLDFFNLVELDMANEESKTTVFGIGHQYNSELAIRICMAVATDTRPIKDICNDNKDFPAPDTINRWRVFHPAFERNFNAAKRHQAQLLIDEIVGICDDPANCVPEILNWAKTRIATRQWLATKLLPRYYGDLKAEEVPATIEDISARLERAKRRELDY